MARPSVEYVRRDPGGGVLYQNTLRPPVTAERLHVGADGQVVLQLRHPWADGTTSLAFEPTAFLERLAVLVPRPRVNLVLHHGVLAPRAAWRAEVVRRHTPVASAVTSPTDATAAPAPTSPDPGSGSRWATLMRRAFGFDVLACPRCGGQLRLIAILDEPVVTERILRHLGLPARVPPLGDHAA